MNGYTLIADTYRNLAKQGKFDKELAEKKVRVLEFLATCDKDDICSLSDSSAFNDIISAYIKLAVDMADIDEESKEKVKKVSYLVFDEKNAKEVLKYVSKENNE